MIAARLHGKHDIRVDTVEAPADLRPGEIRVRPQWCGICGSDLHEYETGGLFVPAENKPQILGHEFSAEVIEVAEDVRSVRVGDRAAVLPHHAHQLDQQKGFANGAPVRGDRAREWPEVLGRAFSQLQADAFLQQPSLFSYYGATNPAEFFAVISEVFFEQPQRFSAEHPALYGELARLYRVDPATW